jgi:lipid-A-disaccharide synthase-like uncharacterized protein
MQDYHISIYLIGFMAQVLFSARLILQWIKSEKVKKVLTPELFWELSLIASLLMLLYGWLRDDFAIMLGQSITYFIYIRNIQLQKRWNLLPAIIRYFLILFPIVAVYYGFNNGQVDTIRFFQNQNIPIWLLIWGSVAQIIFTFRFIYQWIYSEKIKNSHLPFGFWLLSLIGSSMILIYAIIRKDPVLFIGQLFGFFIYIRNITIGREEDKEIKNEA